MKRYRDIAKHHDCQFTKFVSRLRSNLTVRQPTMTIAILTALSLTLTLIFPHSFTVYASAFVSLSISGRYGTVSGSSSQSTQPTTSASSAAQEQSEVVNIHNHIVFPGGGIFFYHQAGIVTYMREEGYDLSRCTMAGASAGALVASLTANDVDFYEAARVALQMAADANVWDRPLGLAGIWGDMNRDWLNQLLPRTTEEVLANVQGRVNLLVTPFPSLGKSKILTFKDRSDFIEANLASIHLVCSHQMTLFKLTTPLNVTSILTLLPFSLLCSCDISPMGFLPTGLLALWSNMITRHKAAFHGWETHVRFP